MGDPSGGLFFAFHPTHFYEVFWVAGISQGGYIFLLLLSVATFIESRRRNSLLFQVLSVLAASAAFLSKEDAVMLPALLSALVLLAPAENKGHFLRLRAVIPYWILLGGYLVLRFWILGFGLPQTGIRQFQFSTSLLIPKLSLYGEWLGVSGWFYGGVLLLLGLLFLGMRKSSRDLKISQLKMLLFFALATILSVIPSLFVSSNAEHYLSFASATLGWLAAFLLFQIPSPAGRNFALFVLAPVFLRVGRSARTTPAHRKLDSTDSAQSTMV